MHRVLPPANILAPRKVAGRRSFNSKSTKCGIRMPGLPLHECIEMCINLLIPMEWGKRHLWANWRLKKKKEEVIVKEASKKIEIRYVHKQCCRVGAAFSFSSLSRIFGASGSGQILQISHKNHPLISIFLRKNQCSGAGAIFSQARSQQRIKAVPQHCQKASTSCSFSTSSQYIA